MDNSRFLAKAIGAYLLIVSLSMFINMNSFVYLVNEMTKNEPLMFVTGFFTLIIGILLVLSHTLQAKEGRRPRPVVPGRLRAGCFSAGKI